MVACGWTPWVCRASGEAAGFPIIRAFTVAEAGIETAGWSAQQDAKGVLYFGSHSLLTYDGDRWRSFPINGSYAIRGLDFGPDRRLWAAAVGELGWFAESQRTWRYHSLRGYLPRDHPEIGDVWHALAWGKGAVFAADEYILRWDGETLRSWRFAGSRHLRAFRVGTDIMFQHTPSGLYILREEGPDLVLSAEIIGQSAIFWIEKTESGWLLLKNDGLFRFANGQLTAVGDSANAYLRQHGPTTVQALPDGRLAIGTLDDGIAFITREGALDGVLGAAAGFSPGSAMPLLVDHEGALWAGSMAAIFRIPLIEKSTAFDARSQFPLQPAVRLGRYEGRLILANLLGVFQLDPATKQFERISTLNKYTRDFHVSGPDLFVTGYRGVTRYSAGQPNLIYSTNSDVLAIAPARRGAGQYYVGDGRMIVALAATGASRTLARGLPDTANSIAEDGQGNLWLGTRAYGFFLAHATDADAQVRPAGESSGLLNPRGEARVATLSDGTVVAFNTTGGWVQDAKTGKFNRIAEIPPRPVVATSSDPVTGGLWVLHRAESGGVPTVARVSRQGVRFAWEPHSVEGLATVGMARSIFAESVGTKTVLWIGGTLEVLRHEFSGEPTAPPPLAPLVRAFARTSGYEVHEIGAAALPYSTRSIDFEFATPQFTSRPTLRIETRIDGIDERWIAAGPGSRREFNAIREGQYVLRTRVVAETGVKSPESFLTFTVLPPWWRTNRATFVMGLGVIFLAYGTYRLRVRTLRRRNAFLEQKVRERTDELVRASAAKTEFVANMSHDIRNPLNGIVGLALALEDTRLDPRQREIIATLRECTTYLSTLVDDVLDFASIEAGKVELRPGRFAAAQLLQSVVMTLKSDTAERGAILSVDVDPRLPDQLVGDAGRIQQILVNYVSNALKYAGGHVRLSVSTPASSPGELEFAVTDDGPGISVADQATLFTKFSRTPSARRQEIPGTGLGLAACRMLADLMGGSVAVTSSPDCGARFCLRLPLVVATEPADLVTAALPNTTVLLVEDTDYNAWAASAVLAKLGLACERARTGREALRLFAEKRFNVVLLDRNLPDMDGTEVARQMRLLETDGAQAVLLAVTAYCTAEDRKVCLESGMDAFVGKPLTPEKLRRILIAAGRRLLAAASVQVSPDLPVARLDMSFLNYLSDGDSDGLGDQVERFLETLVETREELAAAATARDFGAIRTAAHRVLGQARMVGGTDLADGASRLEVAAEAGDGTACGELIELVEAEIRALTAAMRHRPAELRV